MSSILSDEQKLTPQILLAAGYEEHKWGSPRASSSRTNLMYETIDGEQWQVMYFPPEFNGYVSLGTITGVDVSGRAVMTRPNAPHRMSSYFRSPVIETDFDLQTFIHCVKSRKYPNFQKERDNEHPFRRSM